MRSVIVSLAVVTAVLLLVGGCDSGQTDSPTEYSLGPIVTGPSDEPFSRTYLVTDEDGVSTQNLDISVEGGDLEILKSQQNSTQVRVAVSYNPTSRLDDRILHFTGKDDAGFDLTPFTSRIDILGGAENVERITLDMLTRDFESKGQVSGDLLHLSYQDPDIDFDTTLTSDGRFTAQLPIGDYAVSLEPSEDKSPLARVFVTPEHLPDPEHNFIDSGRLTDRDGREVERSNYSYLVFGRDLNPGLLSLTSDYEGFAEVVQDREFVARMLTQMLPPPRNSLIHFDTKKPVVFAVYTGSDTREICGPNFVATDASLGFHEQFYHHNLSIVNSVMVGGNPYQSIERRVVDAESLMSVIWYCDTIDRDFYSADPYQNVSLFWFNEAADTYKLSDYNVDPIYDIEPERNRSLMLVYSKASSPMHALGAVSRAERDAWASGGTTQADVPNGSVRDSERSGSLSDKPFVPENVVQYEFDDRFVKVATAFGPWAQYQLNPLSGERGKNVRLER